MYEQILPNSTAASLIRDSRGGPANRQTDKQTHAFDVTIADFSKKRYGLNFKTTLP